MTEKMIPLTQGKFAIVDAEDFERVSQFKWHAHKSPTKNNKFYAARMVTRSDGTQRKQFMHLFLVERPANLEIDHINHDGLDNRKENLRVCTKKQNQRNQEKSEGKSSIFKGVSWNKQRQKWRARIWANRKDINLGFFNNEVDAAVAYDNAAKKYFKEFACLNLE